MEGVAHLSLPGCTCCRKKLAGRAPRVAISFFPASRQQAFYRKRHPVYCIHCLLPVCEGMAGTKVKQASNHEIIWALSKYA